MKTIVPQLVLIFSLSYIFPAFAETGAAMIKGTEENSPISGTVILEDVGGVGPRRLESGKVYEIEVGSAPFIGPEAAPITVVEWADFQ